MRNAVCHAGRDLRSPWTSARIDGECRVKVMDDGAGSAPRTCATRAVRSASSACGSAPAPSAASSTSAASTRGGTTVTVRFPLGPCDPSRRRFPMIRVLLADDHAVVRVGLRRILETADGHPRRRRGRHRRRGPRAPRRPSGGRRRCSTSPCRGPASSRCSVASGSPARDQDARPLDPRRGPVRRPRAPRAARPATSRRSGRPRSWSTRSARCTPGGRTRRPRSPRASRSPRRGQGGSRPHEALSPREFEVFRMLGVGRRIKEIARASSRLRPKTVSTFRARILARKWASTTTRTSFAT